MWVCFENIGHSIHVDKLIQVEQRTADFRQATAPGEARAGVQFIACRGALEGKVEGAFDLRFRLFTGFAFHPRGKSVRRLDGQR